MKVSGIDYKGNPFSGWWNEKTYSSKEGEGLLRIYVDNEPLHITVEEKNRMIREVDKEEREKARKRAIERSESEVEDFFFRLRGMPLPTQLFALERYFEHLRNGSNIDIAMVLVKGDILPKETTREQVYYIMDAMEECFRRAAKKEKEDYV